ncbi:MAG: polysaccharide pyruvyl transferase family protein [Pseudobutyrivibrio sp.]|nr:polysaccharide pyruvyl transferase family protein [Pseudobutyrivibrio sp.]
MRIAILTYWESDDNYGQLLQCYALQKYLKNKGHDPFLVRYSPQDEIIPLKNRLMTSGFKQILSSIKTRIIPDRGAKIIAAQKERNRITNKQRAFDAFRERYLEKSERIYHSIEDLRQYPPQADMYITGSDQVWRDPLCLKNVAGWYLQFGSLDIKRCSYAASMGRTLKKYEKPIFLKYIKHFNAISVREESVKEQCNSLGIKEAEVVLDPTMLLEGEDYRKIEKIIEHKDKYAVIYAINVKTNEDIFGNEIRNWIEEQGYELEFISSSGYLPAHQLFDDVPIRQASIDEWLGLIDHSDMVFTTSFHGVVFSILFRKKFFWIPLRGEYAKGNNRIIDMLGKLNLSGRILDSADKLRNKRIDSEIDWDSCYYRLNELRIPSYNYIKSITE